MNSHALRAARSLLDKGLKLDTLIDAYQEAEDETAQARARAKAIRDKVLMEEGLIPDKADKADKAGEKHPATDVATDDVRQALGTDNLDTIGVVKSQLDNLCRAYASGDPDKRTIGRIRAAITRALGGDAEHSARIVDACIAGIQDKRVKAPTAVLKGLQTA